MVPSGKDAPAASMEGPGSWMDMLFCSRWDEAHGTIQSSSSLPLALPNLTCRTTGIFLHLQSFWLQRGCTTIYWWYSRHPRELFLPSHVFWVSHAWRLSTASHWSPQFPNTPRSGQREAPTWRPGQEYGHRGTAWTRWLLSFQVPGNISINGNSGQQMIFLYFFLFLACSAAG